MLNSIESIIELHNSEGLLEDAYVDIHFDNKILKLNTYTLKFTSVNVERDELKLWNTRLSYELKKNRNLEKEVKEFRILFDALNKMKIKNGYIKKNERPDFVLEINDKKIGIETTKIYSGNDWVPEKIYDDIKTYNMRKEDVEGYIEYKKYNNKIITYKMKENLIIRPLNKKEDTLNFEIKLKNKLFEKIRKMFDEYESYDVNVILANVVSPEYFEDLNKVENFNNELTFYINHLEANTQNKEYLLLMKLWEKWLKFDLKNHTYNVL